MRKPDTESTTKMRTHPAADIFPMMDEESYQALKEDIRKNGLQEWLTLWKDGSLLDGRNRHRACEELGIEPTCCQFEEDDTKADPYQFVISANLHRRHLTTSQRSSIAGRMAKLKRGEVGNGREVEGSKDPSIDNAAKLLNVSPKSVKRAKQVLEKGSKSLIAAVDSGAVPVTLAAKLVSEVDDKAEQARLVKAGPKAIREFITPQNDAVETEEPLCRVARLWLKSPNRMEAIRQIVDSMSADEIDTLRELIQ